jgi:hypothetical protein
VGTSGVSEARVRVRKGTIVLVASPNGQDNMFNVECSKHHNRLHGPRLVAVSCLVVCVSLAIPELLSYSTLQLAHITVSDSSAAAAPALSLPLDMNSTALLSSLLPQRSDFMSQRQA